MQEKPRKNKLDVLDIHTHKYACDQREIFNYPLFKVSLSPESRGVAIIDELSQDIERLRLMWVNPAGLSTIDRGLMYLHSISFGFFYSVGIHPHDLVDVDIEEYKCRVDLFTFLSRMEPVVAIGEAGLDKLVNIPMDEQMEVFRFAVSISEMRQKPLIIHCVRAMEELLAVRKEMSPKQPWIWHGFRGKPEQAKQLLDQGFYLSFGWLYHEETMAMVPKDRLFIETDNTTAKIETILLKAAKVRGVEPEALRRTIRKNIQKVFFKD